MKKAKLHLVFSIFIVIGLTACFGKEQAKIDQTPTSHKENTALFSFDWESEAYDHKRGRFYNVMMKKGNYVSSLVKEAGEKKSDLKFEKNVDDFSLVLKKVNYSNQNDGFFLKELPIVGQFRVALFATQTMNDNDGGAAAIQLQTHNVATGLVVDKMIIANAFLDECSMNRSVEFLDNASFVVNEHYWCDDFDDKGKRNQFNKKLSVIYRINDDTGKIQKTHRR